MRRISLAFTLIELLVVIAVISILAAFLFPVFLTVRRSSWGSGCISNLKQIGVAMQLYAHDWDDLFPYGIDFADGPSIEVWKGQPYIDDAYEQVESLHKNGRLLPNVMKEYLPTRKVWRCPADNGINFTHVGSVYGGGDSNGASVYEAFGMSYAYRTELALHQKPITSLRHASHVNVLMDAAGYWHTRYARPPKPTDAGDTDDSMKWGYNVLFADSHVRNLNSEGYYTAWGGRLSDRDPFDLHGNEPAGETKDDTDRDPVAPKTHQ